MGDVGVPPLGESLRPEALLHVIEWTVHSIGAVVMRSLVPLRSTV